MLKGFKEFISRGNAVDLAVGMVIGAAFTAVVTALVEKFLNPLIGGLVGKPNFDSFLEFTVGSATVQPGAI
ncbi:MAG: MscL family protein, partial [Actinomyces sp.]|nr:MscL family protein [Actinomyces sp.]